MSQAATRLPLVRAQQLAEAVRGEFLPACVRIEVAGSVRRRCPDVGDIEIVAIPKRPSALFGELAEGDALVDVVVKQLQIQGRVEVLKNGPRYKQLRLLKPDVKLDLFLVTPETWGVQLLLRTGPALFSKNFVTQQAKGGTLPDRLRIADGRLWIGETVVATPEERDVFKAAGMEWVDPWRR